MQDRVLYSDPSILIEIRTYNKGYTMPDHSHDYLTLSMILKGNVVEESDGKKSIPLPGFVSIKPIEVSHRDVFVDDCTFLSFKVFDPKFYKMNFMDWKRIPPGDSFQCMLDCIQAPGKVEPLSRLNDCVKFQTKANFRIIPKWVSHLHDWIGVHYKENFKIEELAKMVNRHPNYVGEQFRKYYGVGLLEYRRYLRLHFIIGDALQTKSCFTTLAHHCGFSDQSHFSREFRSLTSRSPRQALNLLDL